MFLVNYFQPTGLYTVFLIGTFVSFLFLLTTGDYHHATYTSVSQNVIFRAFRGGCGSDDGAG
jgi:hypothetical protein